MKPFIPGSITLLLLSTMTMTQQAPASVPDTPSELPPGVIHMTCVPGAPNPALVQAGQNAYDAITHGDSLLKKGQTEAAIRCYKDAMTYEPDDPLALQKIAEAYALSNRLGEAGKTYHHLFYEARWEGVGGNPCVYLGYALLLARTGQGQEAVKFYLEGAHRLNFDADDKPNLKVTLPTFGNGEGQVLYTPELLQAMAHVGIAVYSQDDKEKLAHLDAAIKLQPDMPQAYFYKGQTLWPKAAPEPRSARRLPHGTPPLVC